MASFFQPGPNDPALADCEPGRFQIYCNSINSVQNLFQPWYQVLNLSVGGAAILIPLVLAVITFIAHAWTRYRSHNTKPQRRRKSAPAVQRQLTPGTWKSARSFELLHQEHIELPDLTPDVFETKDHLSVTSQKVSAQRTIKIFMTNADQAQLSERLKAISKGSDIDAIGLHCSDATNLETLEALLHELLECNIPAVLVASHDSNIWPHVDLTVFSGIVIENACILQSGDRRDYFRSRMLQDVVGRCSKIRESDPDYFVGFADLWEVRPHPAVIRRAVKLAEHFGALLEHGPVRPEENGGIHVGAASQTLSGFEFLRRPEVIELQRSWSTEAQQVLVSESEQSTDVARLPLHGIESVIPNIRQYLEKFEVPSSLDDLKHQHTSFAQPPDYSSSPISRDCSWTKSSQGSPMAEKGCYPITTEPGAAHYNAVVEMQKHLKRLDMLQPSKGADTHRLIKELQQLECGYPMVSLVDRLVEGLRERRITVFKGLDTGFGVPEGVAYFWGVSDASSEQSELDIYISLKAPNDTAAILHTWLAHCGVSRAVRFETECQLEQSLRADTSPILLPASIKTAVDRSSHAEVLSLLQQVRISQLDHTFKGALVDYCQQSLLQDVSRGTWYQTVSSAILDGTMTMEEILQLRLEHYVQLGAAEIPKLDYLVDLSEEVSQQVLESLFFGRRDALNAMTNALLEAWSPEAQADGKCVDLNADLFALIFLSALRKAGFEDVYIEATDRCPFFLSQPDQAAVFSELWVLGSQCEIYFGVLPRGLGSIVYNRYKEHLLQHPPAGDARKNNEIMSMYSNNEPPAEDGEGDGTRAKAQMLSLTRRERVESWKKRFTELGAMSIFCLPAIIDVLLLTFVGRGVFMTAFMDSEHLQAAGLALLISLLLTAGVTGWVGSVGNYYLVNYAYDNMIHFHVQRLSGGFMLTLLVAICGFVGFSVQYSVPVGLVFAAYMIIIATYFNLLGVMATMHQRHSPITSGRTVLWRTIPLLLISPVLSTFVNGHDLEIYLPITLLFVVLAMVQYRNLCREWSGWMRNIPTFSGKDITEWHEAQAGLTKEEKEGQKSSDKDALEAFREAVEAYKRGLLSDVSKTDLVARVAAGMPYVQWLFKKTCPNSTIPDAFTASWFTQLGESRKQQQQLSRGLKEHNVLMLFRFARYDIGQNLGLFLVALMDRWVSIVMGARVPRPSLYIDSRSRYGVCLCILYFCASVMLLDTTLQKYWEVQFKLSDEKLSGHDHAQRVAKEWERRRLRSLLQALRELLGKIMVVFGVCTVLMWLLVMNPQSMILYYCYCLGYTCVILFQFNRCFTTNVRAHITIILSAAAVGFVVGCTLRVVPYTAGWFYAEILAQNVSAVTAALGTFLWTWKDWTSPTRSNKHSDSEDPDKPQIIAQCRLEAESGTNDQVTASQIKGLKGTAMPQNESAIVFREVSRHLRSSLQEPNAFSRSAPWSGKLLQTTLNMWESRNIGVLLCSRQQFVRSGLSHISSVSESTGESLTINIGVLGETELRDASWQPLLAQIVAESALYHVARTEHGLSHSKAVQAEHFLQETQSLSRRLEFELSYENDAALDRLIGRTNVELMKHLCLNVPIESQWELLPESVRQAIVERINGQRVNMTRELLAWLDRSGTDLTTCDFHVSLALAISQKIGQRAGSVAPFCSYQSTSTAALKPVRMPDSVSSPSKALGEWLRLPVRIIVAWVKWVAIITGAGNDIERELWYCSKDWYFQRFILAVTLFLWKFCWHAKNLWIYVMLVHQRVEVANMTRLAQKGARRKIKGSSILVELPRKRVTGFAAGEDGGAMVLKVYDGLHKSAPSGASPLFKAVYDENLRLQARVDSDTLVTTYQYADATTRRPLSKEFSDKDFRTVGFYDKHGRIHRGTITVGETEFAFQYHFKNLPHGNADVLAADFKDITSDTENMISVYWGCPPDEDVSKYNWAPSERLSRIVKVIGGRRYTTQVEYKHRRDPLITTFLDGEDGIKTAVASAPKAFAEESMFLARPGNVSFDSDDLLIYHSLTQLKELRRHATPWPLGVSRLNPWGWIVKLKGSRVYQHIPTWQLRTELWALWLKSDSLDAPTACWLDELILREEPLLRKYWKARDRGRLHEAKSYLDRHVGQIVSAIDMQTDVSEVCALPIKTSDLYAMGLGKDATEITSHPRDCFSDSDERISVVFNDIGCWPEAPGGVSNCRRDLVNGHSTIRNHVLAECANDFGIPRFQIERNVQSLKLLPLWGLDRKTAHHGLIDNLLQSQVDEKVRNTEIQRDIVGVFIPLVKDFVKGARTKRYTRADLIRYSNVVLSMSKYYEQKDYSRTWESKEVEKAWVDAWLVPYNDPNITDPSSFFDIEKPSMSDFREALGIYLAYFFIFSVKIPDRCPRVFQSTHHGISSLFGMILRYRRGVTFGIWDHAILWRECCLNISPAQCELPISVQSMLLSGIGLATRLAYLHADVIMPCTSLFNPMWEAEIATDRGQLSSKKVFSRRIDPIVNGISNMESFTPVDKIRTEKPTVVMLSNVQFIKGIKTAILAADIIVNRYGFKDYQLVVYGAKDRQPSYALEMAKLIVENNLSETVILAGFGKPKEVLKDAWLFMNSSISEGLPLAIGEAALAGVPIVATEVGATALVMTDPEDQDKRYGEVVPPNDPLALARAQLSILGMVGPWAKFTEEVQAEPSAAASAVLPDDITSGVVDWLTQRMYDKSPDRRRLGLLSREVVLHSFHGNRYLREHEQMYWVQWHLSKMRADEALSKIASRTYRFGIPRPLEYEDEDDRCIIEADGEESEGSTLVRDPTVKWQEFDNGRVIKEKRSARRLSKQRPPSSMV
ncbi:uncharacterized protein F5Z01DRAFT_627081 [Emericellopsis atlantica]|uniref:DUF3492 domain-containing protein n=1 Tax=Emericellopsis atlantica TaxID=2614577 RepID=A0A9P7ZGJ3_9HYPO|nr:uncharacterized protein F5Z01DRAFT_627081 [Emericellopsis atlantica]KAG9251738.1 hypothetical protein F5Z01DRAFT_627081 [Emericellopsis atlantica]